MTWVLSPRKAMRSMLTLRIPIDPDGRIGFHATLHELSRRVVGVRFVGLAIRAREYRWM
jgi:hypothetical protein